MASPWWGADVATNKELLEAETFRRRRLVTALVTGASYAEPARALRAVVAGVIVALTIVAGVLAAGYLGAHSGGSMH